jgi:hypothetical protein
MHMGLKFEHHSDLHVMNELLKNARSIIGNLGLDQVTGHLDYL